MTIKEYDLSIQLKCMYIEQAVISCVKEETKCNNIRKQYKRWLTLMMLQNKS